MFKKINVLIIEDEPLIVGVLKSVLKEISQKGVIDFNIKSAANSDDAIFEIRKAVHTIPIDFVLLDISIPISSDEKVLSGEDLGIQIRDCFPKVKIMVLTRHNDNYRLNNILKSLNPEGFIIKTDIDFRPLIIAIETVLDNAPFYSKRILQLMRKHFVNDFTLDMIDRQMLYQISKGAKIKDLVEITSLSKGAIDLRKRNLKMLFGIEENSDRKLIAKAEQHGFI